VLSARGGDAVRLALAKRELPGSSWSGLAGTAVVEVVAQLLVGLPAVALALAIGVDAVHAPSPVTAGAVAVAVAAAALLAARSPRVRRVFEELLRGCAALRHPRRDMSRVLGWELAGRLLRFAAGACFLLAFGLPLTFAAVVVVGVLYGTANVVPIPGAGTAASAGALLVALPAAAGPSVDPSAVAALVIALPLLLTSAGVTISLILLAWLLGARTPAALLRSGRSLIAHPASPTA
jgi:hypothetical protein